MQKLYFFDDEWYNGIIYQFTDRCERLGVSADAEATATARIIASAMIAQSIDHAGKKTVERIDELTEAAHRINPQDPTP